MGPEIQMTMVERRYITRGICDSTRNWLLLVDMSCAMLDRKVVEERIQREYGNERLEKDGMDTRREYTIVVRRIIRMIRSHINPPEPKGVHPLVNKSK